MVTVTILGITTLTIMVETMGTTEVITATTETIITTHTMVTAITIEIEFLIMRHEEETL